MYSFSVRSSVGVCLGSAPAMARYCMYYTTQPKQQQADHCNV